MTLRTLTLATVAALAATFPTPASSAIGTPAACTSLATVCAGSCTSDSVVHIQVVGYGHGDVTCGTAHTSCATARLSTLSNAGQCSRAAYVASGSSYFSCRVEAYSTTPTIAICWSEPGAA